MTRRGTAPIATALSRSSSSIFLVLLLGPLGSVILYLLSRRDQDNDPAAPGTRQSPLTRALFVGGLVWAAFGYLLLLALYLPEIINAIASDVPAEPTPRWRRLMQSILWTQAGASALFAVFVPIVADYTRRIERTHLPTAFGTGMLRTLTRPAVWVLLGLLLVFFVAVRFVPPGTFPHGLTLGMILLLRFGAALWLTAFILILAGKPPLPLPEESRWGHLILLFVALNAVLFVPADWVSDLVGKLTLVEFFVTFMLVICAALLLLWLVESCRALGDFLGLRRVFAIAHLSIKEAIRRKVLWVFFTLLLVVLFASWFIPGKAEDQVRTYVTVVFGAMNWLMLIAAVLIAGFGIPDDMRHQTIHTILTKPVHRFDIFLGRMFGYVALMSVVLLVVADAALFYVLRSINPDAAQESLKAREPLYGNTLLFQGTKDKEKGTNVGHEWDYRGYVEGKPGALKEYAVWSFRDVPADLQKRDSIRLEFTLDIYRTRKANPRRGELEGADILATFIVESWRFDADNPLLKQRYDARKKELQTKGEHDIAEKLAEEFGYYEFPALEIKDNHSQSIVVPAGVFRNAAKPITDQDRERQGYLASRRETPAPIRVRVRCDSADQFLGMAKYDLYFRLDREDPSGAGNRTRFCMNFLKGSFGLWLRLCLITGLAVAVSTYLSGVISLFTSGMLYVLGFLYEFITEVALGKNVGGGPMESVMRLIKRPGGEPGAGQLEESTTAQVATWFDDVFTWTMRRFLNLIPDVGQLNFTDFVSEGVSIGPDKLAGAFLMLVLYLLPWAVLAYYLLKWREVASST